MSLVKQPNKVVTTYTRCTCREQFAALLASSVSRCGASSPAHGVSCNSQLMRSLWCDLVMGYTDHFALVLEPTSHRAADRERVTVSFGVSPIMMGITHSPSITGGRVEHAYKWLGPDARLLYKVDREQALDVSLCLASSSDDDEGVPLGSSLVAFSLGINGKWLVMCEISLIHPGGQNLSVTDIQALQRGEKAAPVVVPYRTGSFAGSHEVMMNNANRDEAFVSSTIGETANFTLVDVAQTHKTNTLVVVSSTQCSFPAWIAYQNVVVQRRASGEVVYVVNLHLLSQGDEERAKPLFLVESSTPDTMTQIAKECDNLSQVSSSLFCVCCRDTFQLWDCNNTTHPLRSVSITSDADACHIKQAVGGSGFLFVLRDDNKVTVMEALSGTTVLTFENERGPGGVIEHRCSGHSNHNNRLLGLFAAGDLHALFVGFFLHVSPHRNAHVGRLSDPVAVRNAHGERNQCLLVFAFLLVLLGRGGVVGLVYDHDDDERRGVVLFDDRDVGPAVVGFVCCGDSGRQRDDKGAGQFVQPGVFVVHEQWRLQRFDDLSKFFRRILRQLNEAAQVEAVKLPPTETTSSSTKEDHSHRHRKHSRTSSASSVLTDSNSATSNKRPSTTPPVVTLELPASATIVDFELMLKFIYDGDVTVTEVNAIPFMKMANYFEVKALKKLAGEYLARHITRENALSMLQRAVEFGAEEVQTKCLGTISKHFSQLIEDEGVDPFLSLPWNIMIALLSQDNLITTSEHLVYATACQYVESNSSKLTSVQVDNLFETVRFPLMTVEQLEEATLNALVPRYLLTEAMLHKLKRHENAGAPATPTTDKKPAAPTGKDVLTKETVKDTAKEAEEKKKAAMLKRQTPRAAFAISLEYTHDFDENGLFYCIGTSNKKEEWTNPAHRGRVRIACSSQEKGDVFDILDRNPREFWTADVPASWVCINLGSGRSFVPNYYTLRHGCNSKADCLRNWLLQGSNDGHNWTVILRHTDDTSLTSNFATASWPITNCTQSYRYFRILQTGHNSANHNFLAISGIEIYGDLYEAKKTTSS
ncbi:E3 ubiquitin-protein ligase Ufd4 [Pelomyxa schiedti]|nr:E3 ubiquitin-protein ligase Ufd4 [Pelomyxa schiedti]